MKRMMLLAIAAIVVMAAPALAFHDDGVAHCNGCHTMHNSEDGDPVADGGKAVGYGWPSLLTYEQPSDVCLDCHGNSSRSYNVFLDDPDATVPLEDYYSAGNFVFLLEDNIYDGYFGTVTGDGSGHNIKSAIKSTDWDQVLEAPPSGDASPMTTNKLHCSSCHDPHGTDSFRLLYKNGQSVVVGGETVTWGPTVEMVAYGIPYGDVETDAYHNVYVSGYSEWCSTCHTGFHASSGRMIHPSGEAIGDDIAAQYNAYMGTTDCVLSTTAPCGSGAAATAYLADVPFEDSTFDETDITSTVGPTGSSVVACVSCHRAHATSAPDAGRWDFNVTLFTGDEGDEGKSGSWVIPRTYNDVNQRSLCNKCHGQDIFDHTVTIP